MLVFRSIRYDIYYYSYKKLILKKKATHKPSTEAKAHNKINNILAAVGLLHSIL